MKIFLKNTEKTVIIEGMGKVALVYSQRKTLAISVNREGQIVVRIPFGMQESFAIDFLMRQRRWVERQIAKKSVRLDISDGVRIWLFGECFVIGNGTTKQVGEVLYLPEENREEALTRYTISLARKKLREITQAIATQYGFVYRSVRITRARGRWGSCSSKGNISYSFRLAFLPPYVIRAVAVHELCHTRHMNHSPAFWKEVEKIIPNYSLIRKELKRYEFIMASL